MPTENNKISLVKLIFYLLSVFIIPALIIFLSGDWFWVEGWLFGLWFSAMCFSTIIYMYIKDPALLAERSRKLGSGNQKSWDKYISTFLGYGLVLWMAIMPLDAKRFGWSPHFALWLKISGGAALIFSLFFIYRAVTDNTFASTFARIQSDRKQHVISTGVYGFVRHPMYLGIALLAIGAPLMLGSLYGIYFSILILVILVVRTLLEERMLVNELEGYSEYKKKVKCRLIPYVW